MDVGGDTGIEMPKHWQAANLTTVHWREGRGKEEGETYPFKRLLNTIKLSGALQCLNAMQLSKDVDRFRHEKLKRAL